MANEFHICVIKSEDFDQLLTEYLAFLKLIITVSFTFTPYHLSYSLLPLGI